MINLIASDMDGTLLNDQMAVSAGNAAAIRRAQAAGITFMVATGRGLSEAQPLIAAHNLTVGFITLNGAMVYDEAGQPVVNLPLGQAALTRTLQALTAAGLYYELVTNRGIFSNSRSERLHNVAALLVALNPGTPMAIALDLANARLELMNINYVADYASVLATPGTSVMKVLAFASGDPARLAPAKAALAQDPALVLTSSAPNNLEINNVAAQKGTALTAYAKQRGIAPTSIMAIGDNYNDESMIRAAKYGVAMGNAVPAIAQLAWRQTGRNTADGVATAIDWAIAMNQEAQHGTVH